MSENKRSKETPIRLGERLGAAFEQLQEKIRERAYSIFLDREPGTGDSVGDWLQAQSELLTPIELEVKEQKKNFVAECNLKGFSPEEIAIEVEDNVLKVFGCHRETSKEKREGGTESRSERVYFFQSAQLPGAVDLDNSHARLLKNGKLKVTLPRLAPPRIAARGRAAPEPGAPEPAAPEPAARKTGKTGKAGV
ncbi:MAG: Hsp20/alpha crystallin family protein [Halioglobus sp.]|jgi:HSP20 family molecular chaperone IbpA